MKLQNIFIYIFFSRYQIESYGIDYHLLILNIKFLSWNYYFLRISLIQIFKNPVQLNERLLKHSLKVTIIFI